MAPLAMAPTTTMTATSSSSRPAPHLSLHLNDDSLLLLVPAMASLSPGLSPLTPASPAYQVGLASPASMPSWGHGHPPAPSTSASNPIMRSASRAHRSPGPSAAAAATATAASPRTPDPAVPLHPIPSMQAAFAESLYEATQNATATAPDAAHTKPRLRDPHDSDPRPRFDALLLQDSEAPPPLQLWRYRPGQTQHELWKLMAQIAFGMHLLLRGMANDNAQVVAIMQGHINEVDEFLETALDDIVQAAHDLSERIELLRLPMENMAVFESLLEKREFRVQIADGNEKIEHVLSRTRKILAQFNDDVAHGVRATREFAAHLAREKDGGWTIDRADVVPIYNAMRGNTDGWMNAFGELADKSAELHDIIRRLAGIVVLMASRASEVSRKTWSMIPPFTVPPRPSSPTDSTISAGSEATRITGFPMPPDTRPQLRSRGHSLTSSAVLPGHGTKSFYAKDENEGGEGDESDDRYQFDTEFDGDDGNDDFEEAEIMEAVECKLPRLTLNMGSALDLRLSLGFTFSDDMRDSRDSVATESTTTDESTFDIVGDKVSDSGDETERDDSRDDGNDTEKEDEAEWGGTEKGEGEGEVEVEIEGTTAASGTALDRQPDDVGPTDGDDDHNNTFSTHNYTGFMEEIRIEIEAEDEGSDIRTSVIEAPPEEDLFILQPRTYTPKLPAPVPSPMVQSPAFPPSEFPPSEFPSSQSPPPSECKSPEPDETPEVVLRSPPSPTLALGFPAPPTQVPRRCSLRQRVSQRTRPPVSIQIPQTRPVASPTLQVAGQTPNTAINVSWPRSDSTASRDSETGRDSAAHDDRPEVVVPQDFARPDPRRRSLSQNNAQRPVPSPFSDQGMFYGRAHTGLESPHAPFHFQQRPHSADAQHQQNQVHPPPRHYQQPQQKQQQQQQLRVNTSNPSPAQFYQHPRQAPSRAGGMSLLSNVTYEPSSALTPGSNWNSPLGHMGARSASAADGEHGKLKKKRSAFGWLRKAFTMDEDERAAFEARRMGQQVHNDFYHEARSSRYLDGRKMG